MAIGAIFLEFGHAAGGMSSSPCRLSQMMLGKAILEWLGHSQSIDSNLVTRFDQEVNLLIPCAIHVAKTHTIYIDMWLATTSFNEYILEFTHSLGI